MRSRRGARPARLAHLALAGAVFAVALAWAAPAFGATIEVGGTAIEAKCNPCHANVAALDDARAKRGAEIKFSHAYHMTYECAACHTSFPHRPEGTAIPKMSNCWACHQMRHGPQGKLAKGECEVCHNTPQAQLRPTANSLSAPEHVANWAEKPHVEPSKKNMRTQCMMCHDGAFCDKCHQQRAIDWKPSEAYTYDPQQNCMVCHGQENLQKLGAGGLLESFKVLGIQQSAHTRFSCTSCHGDFRWNATPYVFSDGTKETKLWQVNAGLGCRDCHEGKVAAYAKDVAKYGKDVEQYDKSTHRQLIANAVAGGDPKGFEAATCSSCHGGHEIQRLDTAESKAIFHAKAEQVCGGSACHKDRYASYNDYYHGAAYKKGAPDAPACWDCHGKHMILPGAEKASMTSPENLAKTCGSCHPGSKESFSAGAKDLIHQKVSIEQANWLQQTVNKIKSFFGFL